MTEATLDTPAEYLTRAQMLALLHDANVSFAQKGIEFIIETRGRMPVRLLPNTTDGIDLYRRADVAYLLSELC